MTATTGETAPLPRLGWQPSQEQLRAYVNASRASQGLPPTVQDPAALERAAAVLRLIPDNGGNPDAMGKPRTARREVARETAP